MLWAYTCVAVGSLFNDFPGKNLIIQPDEISHPLLKAGFDVEGTIV